MIMINIGVNYVVLLHYIKITMTYCDIFLHNIIMYDMKNVISCMHEKTALTYI